MLAASLKSCIRELSDVVRVTNEPSCPARVLSALNRLIAAETILWVVYYKTKRPVLVANQLSANVKSGAFETFIESTYELNPTYNRFLSGLKDGIYRLVELAPDEFFKSSLFEAYNVTCHPDEEVGYVTEGWPEGMTEAILATNLHDGGLSEITLIRSRDAGGFDGFEIEELETIEPLVRAIFFNHWKQKEGQGSRSLAENSCPVRDFGDGKLTSREIDVARLILAGHSSLSAAHVLGISITTIKSHRKNIYQKLGISSQAQLFMRFVEHRLSY